MSQTIQAAGAGVLAANLVGTNGQPIDYWTPEMPFLNIFKQAGSNSLVCGWFTGTAGSLDTVEQSWLQMDADGYVTSLTAIAGHAQTYDRVSTYINTASVIQSGASNTYPQGSYTLQGQGAGTIVLGRDVVSGSLATASPNVSVAGATITSTSAVGVTWSVTFNVVPAIGMQLTITAIAAGNYPKALSIVQTVYMTQFLAGQLFHPLWKAAMGRHTIFRGMKWQGTERADWVIKFNPLTAGLANGATSGNIYTIGPGWTGVNWPRPTGSYKFMFATGQIIDVNCTAGSTALTWATPLSAAIPASNTQDGISSGQAFCPTIQSWETRPAFTNAFWSDGRGVPYEVLLQMGNELNIDPWLCISGVINAVDPTFAGKLAALCRTGAGTTMPGFTGLKTTQKVYMEWSNETWNGSYLVQNFTRMMGNLMFPAQANAGYRGWEYVGVMVANIADAFYAVYGAEQASGGAITSAHRAVVSMNGQYTNPDFLIHTMNTPDWVAGGAAYTHHIGAYHTAPYLPGDSNVAPSVTDIKAILATAVPLDTLFSLMYGNGSGTYPSIPATGLVGGCIAAVNSQRSTINSQPWANYPHLGYEGGMGLVPQNGVTQAGLSGAQLTAWIALCAAATRDVRMGYVYNDTGHLFSANDGLMPMLKVAGYLFLVHFQLVWTANPTGIWGEFESVMQLAQADSVTLKSKSAWPYKAQAIDNYMAGL